MKKLFDAVERNRKLIFDAERYIWKNPETGYREVKTTAYLAEKFEALGYKITRAEDITGFYTTLDTGKPGATILLMCELDSVICAPHPESDPVTGAVHSCGHNAQSAAMLGIAAALREPGVLDLLSGKIILAAVPAEELLEIDYRSKLRAEGKIKYYGGKPEFLSRGYFDGADIAMMVHAAVIDGFYFTKGSVGCRTKKIIYKGRAAHAGSVPHLGKNALYAATLGLNAVNAIRETFREDDMIRVHPIITKGGDMVNAIPAEVILESYVRGKTFEAIDEANLKVNKALIGAALSLGTNIEINDAPGYAPHTNCPELTDIASKAARLVRPDCPLEYGGIKPSSTDNGDLAAVMPAIQPYCGGARGTSHGSDYYIVDPERACIESAKLQLAMLAILGEHGGELAFEIKKNYKAPFPSKEAYLEYLDSKNTSGERIKYNDDGTATVSIY